MASAYGVPGLGVMRRRTALWLPIAVLLPKALRAEIADTNRFLTIVADIVLPETGTAGAAQVGVAAFVEKALAHGMDDTSPETLSTLRAALESGPDGSFIRRPPAAQRAALIALDAGAYGSPTPHGMAWRKVKGLILAGYYTTEVGCTKELAYDLAPGRWDNDIALKPTDRAIANDWFAVSFR